MDIFDGPASQDLGEEREEGMVYSVALKRVRYGSQKTEPPHSHRKWVSQKVRTVKAGTLERLVKHLVPEPGVMEISHVYRTCFLCMYRSFTNTERVIDMLVKRYLSLAAVPEDTDTEKENKAAVQHEIISFLRLWLEMYPSDFYNPPSHPHVTTLHPLILKSHDLERTIGTVIQEETSKEDKASDIGCLLQNPSLQEPSPQQPSPLFSLSPEEFAHSLTSEDARLFLQVSAPQCVDYIRSPKETTNAPTVRACIQHFNRVSLVVIATILGGLAPDARVFIISQWIDIAQHCRVVKNFSSLKAIVSGLQSTAVFRLRKTWLKVASSKLQLFQELSDLLSSDDNHQTSRDVLVKEGTAKYADVPRKKKSKKRHSMIGVVPYLGTFLTDLTMIDSAYPDTIMEGQYINFEKFQKQFQLLMELTLYQKSASNYCFQKNPHLLQWLHTTHTTTPSNSYTLSKQLEPDDSPNNHMLTVPDSSSLTPLSPSKIRKHIRQLFSVKSSTVADFSPGTITTSVSERDISSSIEESPVRNRSCSLSPSTSRKASVSEDMPDGISSHLDDSGQLEANGHGVSSQLTDGRVVVRVASANSEHCNYKSLWLGSADKAYCVIQQSLEKLGLSGNYKEYELFQVMGKKHQLIPGDANVYYALSDSNIFPTLLICPKTLRQ